MKKLPYILLICIGVFAGVWATWLRPGIVDVSVTPELLAMTAGKEQIVSISFKLTGLPLYGAPTVGFATEYDIAKSPYHLPEGFGDNDPELNTFTSVPLTKQGSVFSASVSISTEKARTTAFRILLGSPKGSLPGYTPKSAHFDAIYRVAVTQRPHPLPKDPGEAGKLTLEGIDANHDGLRDDIEREIFFAYPETERLRTAYSELMKSQVRVVTQYKDPQKVQEALWADVGRYNCKTGLEEEKYGIHEVARNIIFLVRSHKISDLHNNTPERERARAIAMRSVGPQSFATSQHPLSSCTFDYTSMPD